MENSAKISTNVSLVRETAATSVSTLLAPICVDVSLVLTWIQIDIPAQIMMNVERAFMDASTSVII